MFRKVVLIALAAGGLALPAAASAQTFYGQTPYAQGYGRGYDGGDYNRGYRQFRGYPEFRGIEQHIRGEIVQGVRDDLIQRDDAQDLFGQLRDIQRDEAREFRVHGWYLPGDDRERLRDRLMQLDRLVDQIREEPED